MPTSLRVVLLIVVGLVLVGGAILFRAELVTLIVDQAGWIWGI